MRLEIVFEPTKWHQDGDVLVVDEAKVISADLSPQGSHLHTCDGRHADLGNLIERHLENFTEELLHKMCPGDCLPENDVTVQFIRYQTRELRAAIEQFENTEKGD